MNTWALVAFALWALFLRYLPQILNFLRLQSFSKTLPGPSVGELIANVKKGEILNWLKELRERHGPVFRIWFGKDLMVMFSDPEDVRQLLGNNALLYKSRNYALLEPWLGKGLLTNGGESWHRRRKLLTPGFHFRILSEFKEPMEENCRILVDRLKERANGEAFDIYPYITLFALDAICETAMGIKKHAQLQSDSEYVKAVQTICRVMHKQSFSFWQRLNIFFKYTQMGQERDGALHVLHDETNRVIRLRREQLVKERQQQQDSSDQQQGNEERNDVGSKRRLAFLDMLLLTQLEGGAELSDRDIREEVDTFMFEGHDTTSSAIAFALSLLSKHSEVQQRAYEEAHDLEGREKESMPYLEAIIKETLRLYPSVPFFSRKVLEDMQVGKHTVPKGASVNCLIYMLHRDPSNFPDPERFDPDRFYLNEKQMHPFAFAAFSAGPRNCIGQKFAMLELKCSLSSLLRSYQFLPDEDHQPIPLAELVMKSGNGIRLRIQPRSRN
ncbi:LOW QUALITY PROTEIN: probable cytochrome P450 4s3 [Drosophila obscura]|uniref:LOW QUALITY PROTEIN: probable cytochrome P450 4s3 n=1 Tax=Drosophila obscura TaxID=7282 RepID=UPI001BB18AB8|nr:LOW QUALITY PROTEIN: probable cytochrome P450 4s3 [Drosophila obscura]